MKMLLICLVAGWFGGWLYAHHTIAGECRRLGKFYVGNTTFECKVIEEKKDER